jgi:uncharacterized protein (TIRG00374 family)
VRRLSLRRQTTPSLERPLGVRNCGALADIKRLRPPLRCFKGEEQEIDQPTPTAAAPPHVAPRQPARAALAWLGLLVSAVFGYFAIRDVRWGGTWTALRTSDYEWLAPALAALTVAFFIRVQRWRSLFTAGRRPPFRAVARALYIGYFFNNVLPIRAGEAFRVVALKRLARVPVAESTGTVVIERAADVLSLVVLLFLMVPWLPAVTWLRAAGVIALGLTVALAAGVVVLARYGEQPLRYLVRPLARLPFLPREAIERAPENLLHGLAGLRRLRLAATAFFWTTLSWIVAGLAFWFVMFAFDLDLSPLAGMLVVVGIGLAMILPSSPAALGVFEGATVVVLGAYGVDDSEALSYALVLHALNFLPFIVFAPVLVRGRSRPRRT